MATWRPKPTADVTTTNWTASGGGALWDELTDLIASPDANNVNCSVATTRRLLVFSLEDPPADFGEVTNVTIQVRHQQTGRNDDTMADAGTVRIETSGISIILAANDSSGNVSTITTPNIYNTSFQNSDIITFAFFETNEFDWHDILLTYNSPARVQVKGNDSITWAIDTFEIIVTYTPAIAASTVFAQAQASIKQIYQVFAQAQSTIKQVYQAYAQAQADTKQIYQVYAQAQGNIKQVYQVYGQSQSHIKNIVRGFGQAQASIKQTYFAYGQAAGRISGINLVEDTFTRSVGVGFGTTDNGLDYTAFVADGTPAILSVNGFEGIVEQNDTGNQFIALRRADLENLQGSLDFKSNAFPPVDEFLLISTANRITSNNENYYKYIFIQLIITNGGSATLTISVNGNGLHHSQDFNDYIILQTDVYYRLKFRAINSANNDKVFVYAKAWQIGSPEPEWESFVSTIKPVSGHVDIDISNQTNVNTIVTLDNFFVEESILAGYGQAQAFIKQIYFAYAQSNASILATNFAYAQSQGTILFTYQQYSQAKSSILQTYQAYGQAQSSIKTVDNGFGQAQSAIKQEYQVYLQTQADIKQTYLVYAQAQAQIKQEYQQHSQAQGTIITSYQVYAQAQGIILQAYQAYGQAQGTVLQTYYVPAQAQATILQFYLSYAQAQAQIAEAGVNVEQGYAQAQATIKQEYNQFGQSQGTILQTYLVYAQAQAIINQTYNAYGQSQSQIKQVFFAHSQAQAYILAIYQNYTQAQGTILTTYYDHGQSQGSIKQTYQQHAQAQTHIESTYLVYAQAQSTVRSTTNVFGNAQGSIKTIISSYGQSQALIKVTLFAHVQAQGFILAAITAGYAQAQAFIFQSHQLKGLAIADTHRNKASLGDRPSINSVLDDNSLGSNINDKTLNLSLSDRRGLKLTLVDKEYT